MKTSFLLGAVLNGVLGSSRKRSRGARSYLTGHGGLLSNPARLMTAAGLAWGVIETLRGAREDRAAAPAPAAPPPAPSSSDPDTAALPPLPSAGGPPDTNEAALRLIRLAISAAYADGTMNEHERAAILQQATAAGMSEEAARELSERQPVATIVAGVSSPQEAATLYAVAFTIVRADEQVSGSERIYLAQLAHTLGLEHTTIEALEKEAGARIDALGDQGQLGG